MLINQFQVRLSAYCCPGLGLEAWQLFSNHPLSHACSTGRSSRGSGQISEENWVGLEVGVEGTNPLTSLLSSKAQGLPPGLGPGDQTCLTLIWNQCLGENLSVCFVQITCLPGQLSGRVLQKPPGSLPCCGGRVRVGHQARPCTQGLFFSVATMKTSL